MNIWTDGAQSARRVGGWAYKIEGEPIVSGLGGATNNEAELEAILQALLVSPVGASIIVHSDSKLAINLLSKRWTPHVARLQDYVKACHSVIVALRLRVQYVHTHGHADDRNNLAVDRAAARLSRTAPLVRDLTN